MVSQNFQKDPENLNLAHSLNQGCTGTKKGVQNSPQNYPKI